jgi:hypothetical protein
MGASVKRFDGRDLGTRKPVMNLLQLLAGEHVVLLVLGPPSRHTPRYHIRFFFAPKAVSKKKDAASRVSSQRKRIGN